MRFSKTFSITLLFIIIGVLTGCTPSIDDVKTETKSVVGQAFEQEPVTPNNEKENFSYFLPDNLEIESEGENNVILQDGDQIFILFVNQNEAKNSEEMYNSISPESTNDLLNETFSDDNRFCYVKVIELDNNNFEVSVGIGGVKMTTESPLKDVSSSAEEMMQVVSSVIY